MRNSYEVLGLKQGATPEEIKKAYFTLVRQYPPEENPEEFREIREAYEQLNKSGKIQNGPEFEPITDQAAAQMLKEIQEYQRIGNPRLFRDACEEARRIFPNEIQFLYLLAIAQRRMGNTGKSVKSGEELIKLQPENVWFWKELAISYMERGYSKKAFSAFQKAYALGCRESDFLLLYSQVCEDYGMDRLGEKLLSELILKEGRWEREQISDLLEAYAGFFILCESEEETLRMIDRLKGDIQRYSIYMKENMGMIFQAISICLEENLFSESGYQRLNALCDTMEQVFHSEEEKKMVQIIRDYVLSDRIYADERLSETVKQGSDLFFNNKSLIGDFLKFAWLDIQLCMIEEQKEILAQEKILKEEYPEYYEKLAEFLENLKNEEKIGYLKDKLLKQFLRLGRYGQYGQYGQYGRKYPEEIKRKKESMVSDGDSDKPYVRNERKIGRNEPCPCGSGKKYKYCCGQN